jgi:hypothetical protein
LEGSADRPAPQRSLYAKFGGNASKKAPLGVEKLGFMLDIPALLV